MTISDDNYNSARDILAKQGSNTASKSHRKHGTKGGSPESHGKDLLKEARDEFRLSAIGQKALKSGMIDRHHKAVHDAARKMGVSSW